MIETIFGVLLFAFSFLISYGLLRKIKIFPSNVNTIVSLVIAFYFIYASLYFKENIIQVFAYSLLFLFVAFVVILVILGLKKEKKEDKK